MKMSDKRILDLYCDRLLDCGAATEWFFNGSYHVRIDSRQYGLSLVGSSVRFVLEKEV